MPKTKMRPAAIFSDHMVVQREKDIDVFGAGVNDRTVTVEMDGNEVSTPVEAGFWRVSLPSVPVGGPYTMTITDGTDTVCFHDILAGEVWLAGGQSNMELELRNCLNGEEEVAQSGNDCIRFFNVPKFAWEGEQLYEAEDVSSWQVCGAKTSATMSAVAYFCARKLQEALNVPVGIIDCYWGGTSISCWMDEEQLARTKAGQRYLDDYAALVGDKTEEQYDAEMEAYFRDWNAWNARVQAMRAKDPDVTWETLNAECGVCPWPQPAGRKSPFRPSGLYHTMIARVKPYTVRGFLYYQGEEDETRCTDYGEMLGYLIGQWRGDWEDAELPFVFVQLPRFVSKADYDKGEDTRHWCILRENQWRVSRTIKNTALAVTIDCGEFDNIHPLDKQTVGKRLALQALKTVYGRSVAADGPAFHIVRPESGGMRIWFVEADGLHFQGGKGVGFEVAGADGVYHSAEAVIKGKTVFVRSGDVPVPCYVRYAWFSWGEVSLFNAHGLPATPFRSRRCY